MQVSLKKTVASGRDKSSSGGAKSGADAFREVIGGRTARVLACAEAFSAMNRASFSDCDGIITG